MRVGRSASILHWSVEEDGWTHENRSQAGQTDEDECNAKLIILTKAIYLTASARFVIVIIFAIGKRSGKIIIEKKLNECKLSSSVTSLFLFYLLWLTMISSNKVVHENDGGGGKKRVGSRWILAGILFKLLQSQVIIDEIIQLFRCFHWLSQVNFYLLSEWWWEKILKEGLGCDSNISWDKKDSYLLCC